MKQKAAIALVFLAMLLLAGSSQAALPVKIKAATVYEYATEEQRELAFSNGINLFITQFGEPANLEAKLQNGASNGGYSITALARYAKEKNTTFFPGIHFRPPTATGGKEGIYYNGTEMKKSRLIPPLDRNYWAVVTEKIKNLASVAKNPEYKIDGIFIDFEMYETYGETRTYFSYNGSFDDETFGEFIAAKSLSTPAIDWSGRYGWLNNNGLLDDYNFFVKAKAEELARNMRAAIDSENPDFLLGSYQSPAWENGSYYRPMFLDFFKGWKSTTIPILFGTDMYESGGVSKIPGELTQTGDHFSFARKDMPESVELYYVGGFLLSRYPPENFSQVLETAQRTNGHWLFSFILLYSDCSAFPYNIPVNCGTDPNDPGCCINYDKLTKDNWKTNCCPYWQAKKPDYWNAIKLTNYKLDCEQTNSGIEICDQKDNDCDAEIDEGTVCCGNGTCEAGETFENCLQDCKCGNGTCQPELGETTESCQADCGPPQECVDNEKLVGDYIPKWKRGEISMLSLMQKMRQWKAGTGCPPGQ
ncbi:MAG: hypothetical protein Q8N60_02600 [Candidatus Diapherotrites archaeon]|nr:hypothetical protein [Candidatus Diapherotrites archaeon]